MNKTKKRLETLVNTSKKAVSLGKTGIKKIPRKPKIWIKIKLYDTLITGVALLGLNAIPTLYSNSNLNYNLIQPPIIKDDYFERLYLHLEKLNPLKDYS